MDNFNDIDDTTISDPRKSPKHAGPRKRRPKKKYKHKTKAFLPDDAVAIITEPIKMRKKHYLAPNPPLSYVAAKKQLCSSAPSFSPQTSAPSDALSPQAGGNDVETTSRAYWSKWAIEAAENERTRRLVQLADIQLAEDSERRRRQQWALREIEAEQQSRTASIFLDMMQNTAWFQATITPSFLDYEVVCPHSWFGCTHSCMLRHVDEHLRMCPYRQIPDTTTIEEPMDLLSYDLVCPNAILGCKTICSRDTLAAHLAECQVLLSPEAEWAERIACREGVIQASEDERKRRMQLERTEMDSSFTPLIISELQRLYNEHALVLQRRLHDEILAFTAACREAAHVQKPVVMQVLAHVTHLITREWPAAVVAPYGSFVTQLQGPCSDVDVIVVLSDFISSRLENLLDVLSHDGTNPDILFMSLQSFPHAAIPLLKVVVVVANSHHSEMRVPLDITFWAPCHHGLASATLCSHLCASVSGLAELTVVLKHFLVTRGMHDVYRGGLSSYGLVSLTCFASLSLSHFLISMPKVDACPVPMLEPEADPVRIVSASMKVGMCIAQHMLHQQHQKYEEETCLGAMLMDVLRYFGTDFQPEVDPVLVWNSNFDIKVDSIRQDAFSNWSILFIQDPFNELNNVGRSCYRISHILRSFNDVLSDWTSMIAKGMNEKSAVSLLDRMIQGEG